MGFLSLYVNVVTAKKYGNKKIISNVSSNNPAIINQCISTVDFVWDSWG